MQKIRIRRTVPKRGLQLWRQQLQNSAEQAAIIDSLEADIETLMNLLAGVSRDGSTIVFEDVNLQIVNGNGATDSTVQDDDGNGVGNLIVGYNEKRSSGSNKSGSHNLIVGPYNNYPSYGGLVAGSYNTISGNYSSVSGGKDRSATGQLDWAAGTLYENDEF